MLKILTIIGARPQIIKAAALSRAISKDFDTKVTEIIVHTGQHYDNNMSQVFFEELGIPQPNYNLNVGSGSHAAMTAQMMTGLEEILIKEEPQAVVVYGDTNSTLAGAIVASKMHIPLVHIEAGLRSFNKAMPEEINRVLCDHVSTVLFSPTLKGRDNLIAEGLGKNQPEHVYNANPDKPLVYHCGDVMYDNSLHFSDIANEKTNILERLAIKENEFVLATIHRDHNTDDAERLESILYALNSITTNNKIKLVLPIHPRTNKCIAQLRDSKIKQDFLNNPWIIITEPVSFLEMIRLEKACQLVLTDSGGVQKEAFFFEKPCIVLRPETEWIELLENGTTVLADANSEKIISAYDKLSQRKNFSFPTYYGDGKAANFIVKELIKIFSHNG